MTYLVERIRSRRRGEAGSTLLMAMVMMTIAAVLLAALTGYAAVNQKSLTAYQDVREVRYAGDSAINASINWAQDQWNVGRDPLLAAGDPACVVHVPSEIATVTASCAAEAGSGSGEPAQGGLVPEEGLVLLGDRLAEPGPFNTEACKGWWDTFTGWFASGTDPNATGPGEYSAWFRVRKGLNGFLGSGCDANRARTKTNFNVAGDVASAGRIVVETNASGSVLNFGALNGTITARKGCSGYGVSGCGLPGTRASDGSPKDTDPARPVSPAMTPTDIKEAWLPVGFQADGTLRSGYSMPVRTTAYVWNPGAAPIAGVPKNLSPTSTCSGVSATIVFLPGWYKNASLLNSYTTAAACNGVTFWFAPDAGADNTLMTLDDKTGAFYMDFREGASQGCNGMPAKQSRWCIGGSPTNNIRVVTGIPNGWSPLGGAPISGGGPGDTRTRVQVEMNTANTVDSGLSQVWYNSAGAKTIGDASVAYYQNCSLIFFPCPSLDRAIRVRNMSPSVTGPPIDDPPGYPKGRLYASVSYGASASLDAPTLEIAAVSNESGSKNCGTYNLPQQVYGGTGGLATYTFTDAQAKQLADSCGSIDLINGFEYTLKTTGNFFNSGSPKVWLDGVRLNYDSFQGANFPNPNPAPGSGVAAQSDCDDTTPGAQLIFGGESHVYVADGSLEICGGPYPVNPENHQVIGLYGVPEVASYMPSTVTDGGGNDATLFNGNNAKKIDNVHATLQYGDCNAFCGASYEEGRANLSWAGYTAPYGMRVKSIDARVSYNPKNSGCFFLWSCPGASPQLRPPSCAAIDLPKNPDNGNLQVANLNSLRMYTYGSSSCLTSGQIASGFTMVYAARAKCTAWVCIPIWKAHYQDSLDGVELSIALEPTGTTPRLIPASGCRVAHPNYGGGEGLPDCAVLRADTSSHTDTFNWPWTTKEGQWVGRVSVKGTIYAPSDAMEVDDTDYAYALASRGTVLRHLRISGWGNRSGYSGPAVTNEVDKTPAPRVATFSACTQTAGRISANAPCDPAIDAMITRARVRFELDPNINQPPMNGDVTKSARVPRIEWWSTDL